MAAMEPGGRLLCAIDRDERAPALVVCARQWAAATDLDPLFVHACEPADADVATDAMTALGIGGEERCVLFGEPAAAVLDAIRAEDPALVLIASGSGDDGGGIGGVCSAVLERAARPVAVLPPDGEASFSGGPIACAVSLGEADEVAVRFAGALASTTSRRLSLAHVVGAKDAALLAAARASGRLASEDARVLAASPLAERLVGIARDSDADALVVASRTSGPAADSLLSSVTRWLWQASPCPVIVITV
jgi:nucleotide-binding universal stress UspA family protein